jgi:hypothetical protein
MFWIKNINTLHDLSKASSKQLSGMKSSNKSGEATATGLDMVALEKALGNENNTSISNLTTRKINAEKWRQLQQLGFEQSVCEDYYHKLREYRYIDDLDGLLHGSYIRWIDLKNPENLSLARGAMICDIKIGQKGVQLLCKTHPNPAMFYVIMDEAVVFQRLTQQERVILAAMDYLDDDPKDDTGSESSSSER